MTETDYMIATSLASIRGAAHLLQGVHESILPLEVTSKLRVARIHAFTIEAELAKLARVTEETDEGETPEAVTETNPSEKPRVHARPPQQTQEDKRFGDE
jgi:hypothetical protein